ncbi:MULTISPECIES: SPFH domain-containing protein [unclassified Methylibium]|uniref:SPFH domain-containing protein n=1 Tax=unclassified Methylibium TaxID=2633235 RepID=UPI0007124DDB|nr:SPFH domain-containing protein [Methylibium sp. Root1272]KQW66184.1 hypothetical protein ASC67_13745 [Methylibium sp. Root1272]
MNGPPERLAPFGSEPTLEHRQRMLIAMNIPENSRALRHAGSNVLRQAAGQASHADTSSAWNHSSGHRESQSGEERIHKLVIAVEQACTSDVATVNVGAELFWSRARAVDDSAADPTAPRELDRIAHASLAEAVSASTIGALLLDRHALEQRLYLDVRSKAADWGLAVSAVAVREVTIPAILQFDNETRLVIALKQRVMQHRADRTLHAVGLSSAPAKDET